MLLSFRLLDDAEVAQAQALLAQAPWQDGRLSAGTQAAQAKNNQQLPADCDAARALQRLLLGALDRSPFFLSAALPARVFPPRFNRYSGDHNHYGRHVDNAIRLADVGVRVRTDLSCTVFLSPASDYDGGELVVYEPQSSQRVKLDAGHAVLYPATQVHEVLPVTRGARVASFFWVQSLVRSLPQRQLLLELDTALMALRNEGGDNKTTVTLTGIYHNLLRMWAEP